MKKQKFLRTDSHKYSKLGVRRKKKQVYRKGKGRDNKIRLKMKGHLRNVSVGFRTEKKNRGAVKELRPVIIQNLKDLMSLKKEQIGIIGKIGKKKKKEIAEYCLKNKTQLENFNPKKFLRRIEVELKKAKNKRLEKKKIKAKKSEKVKEKKRERKKEGNIEQKVEEKKIKEIEMVDAVKNTESDIKENVEDKK